jgi:hypothetical protein
VKNVRSRSCWPVLTALTLCLASVESIEAQQETGSSTGSTKEMLRDWRRSRVRAAKPKKQGCFASRYPEAVWAESSCVTPPDILFRPHHGGGRGSQTVGDGTDFSAQIPGNAVTMEGSFDSVSSVTSETGGGTPNAYTLQLNSEFFFTTTCTGGQSGCAGWEQFIFLNLVTPSQSIAFIQYWMLDYGTSCPPGWKSGGGTDCYRNSAFGAVVPVQTIASLGQMTLTGVAPSGTADDSVTVSIDANLYSVAGNAYFPDLAQQWNTSEFNVLGPGNSSQAVFNAGANMVVRTAIDSGTLAASCVEEGFTAETNNLTLTSGATTEEESPWSSIVFTQSETGSSAPATCAGVPGPSTIIDSDGPMPLWALMALGAAFVGIARYRLKRD